MNPGERYFIGKVWAYPICEPVPPPPCSPPHDFVAEFYLDGPECEDNTIIMGFACPGSPVEGTSWGTIKELYR